MTERKVKPYIEWTGVFGCLICAVKSIVFHTYMRWNQVRE